MTRRSLILRHYVKLKLWVDCVSILSILSETYYLRMLVLLRVLSLQELENSVDEYFQLMYRIPSIYQLVIYP